MLTQVNDWRLKRTDGRLTGRAPPPPPRLTRACTIVPLKPNELTPHASVAAANGTVLVGRAKYDARTPSRSWRAD